MMMENKMRQEIKNLKPKIMKILKENGVIRAGIFGSYARGDERKKSDIDILIEVKGEVSLIDLIKLEELLKKTLKKDIDLLTYESISPYLKETILAEEVKIL